MKWNLPELLSDVVPNSLETSKGGKEVKCCGSSKHWFWRRRWGNGRLCSDTEFSGFKMTSCLQLHGRNIYTVPLQIHLNALLTNHSYCKVVFSVVEQFCHDDRASESSSWRAFFKSVRDINSFKVLSLCFLWPWAMTTSSPANFRLPIAFVTNSQ